MHLILICGCETCLRGAKTGEHLNMFWQAIYNDLVPLSEETLAASSITIVPVVRTRSGSTMALNSITVPTGMLLHR